MNNINKLNIVFAGTPEFAKTILADLLHNNFNIIAIYTQPDKPSGRGKLLAPSPVKIFAQAHNIPVLQPLKLKNNPDALTVLSNLKPDLMLVAAYGLILPEQFLSIPRLGCINVHASILPKWRGAAPIQRALLSGEHETGVTIMHMDAGMDTGNILEIATVPISYDDTSSSLHEKLAILGAKTLINVLHAINNKIASSKKQDNSKATHAKKLNKSDAQINFFDPAEYIERSIRAFIPWPIAFAVLDTLTIRVFKALVLPQKSTLAPGTIINNKEFIDVATATYDLRLLEIQLSGGKRLSTTEILKGYPSLFTINKQFSFNQVNK